MNIKQSIPGLNRAKRNEGFTLLEVIIAAAILGLGLLSIVKVFPYGIEAARRAEDLTQATLLAQDLFEGMKSDPINFPLLPGASSVLIPMPGNGYDDDTNNEMFNADRGRVRNNPYDLNNNGKPDVDFDGLPEKDGAGLRTNPPNGIDDDGDGAGDDNGDSFSYSRSSTMMRRAFAHLRSGALDGDYYYDPEPNIDEEIGNGKDDDGDGLIDEDCRLASVRISRTNVLLPLLAGDGMDNDGDGEDNDDDPRTPAIADGIDNDGDGMIDEGIDEEIWDGFDNDKDGLIDEDCQNARFPFSPSLFPAPFSRYSWQIFVGRIPNNGRYGIEDVNGDGSPDLGDGIDNDGDGLVDEELPDGLDLDYPIASNRRQGMTYLKNYAGLPQSDGLVDEDCIAAPLPNWRRVDIVISWGGDGEDNDGDSAKARVDPQSTYQLGDTLDQRNRRMTQRISYGAVSWGIDEEKLDGIDNDFDGEIDEDCYKFEFKLTGFINLENPSQSFTMTSGQPRGLAISSRE
ncbi:MAG: type II secretion system protein [Candidatus Omnitrophota bacterium]